MKDWADAISAIARAAGEEILSVYQRDFEVTEKADASPLTQADLDELRQVLEDQLATVR